MLLSSALLLLLPARLSLGCDAGVFWGANCTQELVDTHPPGFLKQCNGFPLAANATSSATTLIWRKAGPGFGGKDDLGGDVFLSTTLNMGCGGGYYGSQFHWNATAMNLDWAIWDVSARGADGEMHSTNNTHPVSPPGKPWRCGRYSGEGHGTHCGLGVVDGFLWELGTPYTLNISLVEGNASAALFGATITNEKTAELIEVGKILTTNPGCERADIILDHINILRVGSALRHRSRAVRHALLGGRADGMLIGACNIRCGGISNSRSSGPRPTRPRATTARA